MHRLMHLLYSILNYKLKLTCTCATFMPTPPFSNGNTANTSDTVDFRRADVVFGLRKLRIPEEDDRKWGDTFLFIVVPTLIFILFFSFIFSNIDMLSLQPSMEGLICGIDKHVKDKPYQFFPMLPDLSGINREAPICVERCFTTEDVENGLTVQFPVSEREYSLDSVRVIQKESESPVYDTTPYANALCLPVLRSLHREVLSAARRTSLSYNAMRIFGSLIAGASSTGGGLIFGLIVALFLMFLIKKADKSEFFITGLVYGSVTGSSVLVVGGLGMLLSAIISQITYRNVPETRVAADLFKVFAGLACVCLGVLTGFVFWMRRNRIPEVTALFAAVAEVTNKIQYSWAPAVIAALSSFTLVILWMAGASHLVTVGSFFTKYSQFPLDANGGLTAANLRREFDWDGMVFPGLFLLTIGCVIIHYVMRSLASFATAWLTTYWYFGGEHVRKHLQEKQDVPPEAMYESDERYLANYYEAQDSKRSISHLQQMFLHTAIALFEKLDIPVDHTPFLDTSSSEFEEKFFDDVYLVGPEHRILPYSNENPQYGVLPPGAPPSALKKPIRVYNMLKFERRAPLLNHHTPFHSIRERYINAHYPHRGRQNPLFRGSARTDIIELMAHLREYMFGLLHEEAKLTQMCTDRNTSFYFFDMFSGVMELGKMGAESVRETLLVMNKSLLFRFGCYPSLLTHLIVYRWFLPLIELAIYRMDELNYHGHFDCGWKEMQNLRNILGSIAADDASLQVPGQVQNGRLFGFTGVKSILVSDQWYNFFLEDFQMAATRFELPAAVMRKVDSQLRQIFSSPTERSDTRSFQHFTNTLKHLTKKLCSAEAFPQVWDREPFCDAPAHTHTLRQLYESFVAGSGLRKPTEADLARRLLSLEVVYTKGDLDLRQFRNRNSGFDERLKFDMCATAKRRRHLSERKRCWFDGVDPQGTSSPKVDDEHQDEKAEHKQDDMNRTNNHLRRNSVAADPSRERAYEFPVSIPQGIVLAGGGVDGGIGHQQLPRKDGLFNSAGWYNSKFIGTIFSEVELGGKEITLQCALPSKSTNGGGDISYSGPLVAQLAGGQLFDTLKAISRAESGSHRVEALSVSAPIRAFLMALRFRFGSCVKGGIFKMFSDPWRPLTECAKIPRRFGVVAQNQLEIKSIKDATLLALAQDERQELRNMEVNFTGQSILSRMGIFNLTQNIDKSYNFHKSGKLYPFNPAKHENDQDPLPKFYNKQEMEKRKAELRQVREAGNFDPNAIARNEMLNSDQTLDGDVFPSQSDRKFASLYPFLSRARAVYHMASRFCNAEGYCVMAIDHLLYSDACEAASDALTNSPTHILGLSTLSDALTGVLLVVCPVIAASFTWIIFAFIPYFYEHNSSGYIYCTSFGASIVFIGTGYVAHALASLYEQTAATLLFCYSVERAMKDERVGGNQLNKNAALGSTTGHMRYTPEKLKVAIALAAAMGSTEDPAIVQGGVGAYSNHWAITSDEKAVGEVKLFAQLQADHSMQLESDGDVNLQNEQGNSMDDPIENNPFNLTKHLQKQKQELQNQMQAMMGISRNDELHQRLNGLVYMNSDNNTLQRGVKFADEY